MRSTFLASLLTASAFAAPAIASASSITDRLSADRTAVEVTSAPAGTTKIHVAVMTDLKGDGTKYVDIPASQTRYVPSPSTPVVDIQAVGGGGPIGGWAGRIQTTPEAKEEPPQEEPQKTGMIVGLDAGGWAWESAVRDFSSAVRYVRASYRHYSSDSQVGLLAKYGVTLMPLFGEGGTLAGYDNAGFINEIVGWFKRYGKGGTYWAGRPVDLGATTCELINEPGNPYFYPDYNNYQLYANITKAVHSALEANFPAAVRPKLLVSYDGGFNGSPYGRAIFAAGAVADGVTVHPYGGHGSESALGGRERVTQAHSETGLPVYVTEVGWPTATGMPATGDSLQWTEQQQAENITGFVGWARSLGYVNDVTYFNYADYGTNNWYGIVNSSGSTHKLAFYALKAAAAEG